MTLIPGGTRGCEKHKHRFRNGGMSRTSDPRHRKWAAAVLKRDKRVCALRLEGCTFIATEADHIIPVAEGGDEYALWNGRAVCSHCHRLISSQQGHKAAGHKFREFDPPPF